jgi:hypothetical protein
MQWLVKTLTQFKCQSWIIPAMVLRRTNVEVYNTVGSYINPHD